MNKKSRYIKISRTRYKFSKISDAYIQPDMYDPWNKTDESADAIIKLIEERERKEAMYSQYGEDPKHWNIVSLRDAASGKELRSRDLEQNPTNYHRGRPQNAESAGSWRRADEVGPSAKWGKATAESLDKKLRTEIETVEWKVRRRSESSEERDSRSRRRKQRQSRSRSGSRSKTKRGRSRSREKKRYRSGSRERKQDRKKRSDRQRSSSSDDSVERKPSPRKHSKTTQPKTETPANVTPADIISKFVSIMSNAKEKTVPDVATNARNSDMLPEFDPSNKGHAIVTWLLRVEDIAKLFGWNEKEMLRFSLPKLVGDAKTWYQTLTDVPFSWSDWRKALLEQFPCPNFADLLKEMITRKTLPTETFEQYYYAKIVLLNRCGFKGRKAVDCMVQGVDADAIRLCASAAQFAEPEELLVYLKSAESLRQIPKTNTESIAITKKPTPEVVCFTCGENGHKTPTCPNKNQNQPSPNMNNIHSQNEIESMYEATATATQVQAGPNSIIPGDIVCYYCGKKGHKSTVCRIRLQTNFQPKQIFNKKFKTFSKNGKFSKQNHPNQFYQPEFGPEQVYEKPKFRLCYVCKLPGHKAFKCPNKINDSVDADASAEGAEAPEAGPGRQPAPPGLEGDY